MTSTTEHRNLREDRIRDWMPLLFLIDVGLMFLGVFVANEAAWWIWLPFHAICVLYTLSVLYLAQVAVRYIPKSIPFQHQIGVFLYLSCHAIQFFGLAEIPIALVGYILLAGPLALLFLFDHLNED